LESYAFILGEPDFARAFASSFVLAAGMTAIALPLGGVLAFLVVRTDLPGKSLIEPALLVPIVLSPIVIAFGYVVAVGLARARPARRGRQLTLSNSPARLSLRRPNPYFLLGPLASY